jgi:hypothetical protein
MTTPYPPVVPPVTRTSGLAIAGFVCAFFCSPLGLIFSIMGHNECKRSGGTIGGAGLALAGIIISSVSLAFMTLGVAAAIAIPAFMSSMEVTKKSEAVVQLDEIGKAASIEYMTNATYPIGMAPLTPATDCCTQNFEGKRQCEPDPAQFAAPVWQALGFQLDVPHRYQYTYESADGQSFTATATGDLDCDGTTITYVLEGDTVSGAPRVKPVGPPPSSD